MNYHEVDNKTTTQNEEKQVLQHLLCSFLKTLSALLFKKEKKKSLSRAWERAQLVKFLLNKCDDLSLFSRIQIRKSGCDGIWIFVLFLLRFKYNYFIFLSPSKLSSLHFLNLFQTHGLFFRNCCHMLIHVYF